MVAPSRVRYGYVFEGWRAPTPLYPSAPNSPQIYCGTRSYRSRWKNFGRYNLGRCISGSASIRNRHNSYKNFYNEYYGASASSHMSFLVLSALRKTT